MLAANSSGKGAVANIPNVTSIPYFTTIPVNPVPLDAATANLLNTNFAGYNATLDAFKGAPFNLPPAEMDSRKITFAASNTNRVVINDETARDLGPLWDALVGVGAITAGQRAQLEPYRLARQAVAPNPATNTAGDLVILPAASFIGTLVGGNPLAVNGVSVPLADNWILLPSEQTEIQNVIDGYNTTIANAVSAQAERLVLFDANAVLAEIRTGTVAINGSSLTASISPPFGAFSLDGVHPNQRCAAYMANKMIQVINGKWGSKIPECNPNDYPGNALPTP
jgi:phospholipase/lecithinase/hemolysin